MSQGVLLEEDHGAIRVLTLNRPQRRNALNTELLRALEERFGAAESDDGVDVIVLTGIDPAF
jgi:enoyl-CoA hydratase